MKKKFITRTQEVRSAKREVRRKTLSHTIFTLLIVYAASVSFIYSPAYCAATETVSIQNAAAHIGEVRVKLQSADDNIKCTVCHDNPKMKERLSSGKLMSFFVDKDVFGKSTHGTHTCTSCHKDIVKIPHGPGIKSVNCSSCHYVDNVYGAPTTKADIERYSNYQKSVHKRALDAGNANAPACQDCHGSHDIVSPKEPLSRINRKNIPQTCGRCHLEEYTLYKTSIHGEEHEKGVMETAICTDCHGEHNIFSAKDSHSNVNAAAIPDTCGKCHKAEKLMEKFGIKAEQYDTYRESYHGKANKFGVTTVANCASCHGYHDIRAPNDTKSSVNVNNLPKTCGKCHKGANINYTKGKIHVAASEKESGLVYWIALAFKILTFGTVAALVGHILLDLMRRILSGGKKKHG